MTPPSEKQVEPAIVELLSDFVGSPVDVQHVGYKDRAYDFVVAAGANRFITEYRSTPSSAAIATAIDGLARAADDEVAASLPLLVVPFMGEVGRKLCERAKISWFDLCGNANIVAPGLRILIAGRPNKFIERGRPPNIFAPKSSRVTRSLLLEPQRFQTQAELARRTGLGDGYVSKIVRRLESEQYVVVDDSGAVRPRNPDLLLDAWHEAYDFEHHRIIKGHVAARSGEELLRRVGTVLSHGPIEWAVTGLGAAWLYTSFAAFRLTTIYLSSLPSRRLLNEIEFSDEPKGANLWFVLPDDDGVFAEKTLMDGGMCCVAPLQTYLDLKGQPERAREAAAELRKSYLKWNSHVD